MAWKDRSAISSSALYKILYANVVTEVIEMHSHMSLYLNKIKGAHFSVDPCHALRGVSYT